MAMAGAALLAWDGRAATDVGYLYLSPVPGARHVSPYNRLLLVRLNGLPPTAVTNLSSFITVRGASSGLHTGQTHVAMDGRTIIHAVTRDFTTNELVTVTLEPRAAAGPSPDPYQYEFAIATPVAGQMLGVASQKAEVKAGRGASSLVIRDSPFIKADTSFAKTMSNGVSVPADFPQVTLTIRKDPAPDYIWLENAGQNGQLYRIILDTWGNPVFYQRGSALDFKQQKNGTITWPWGGFVCVDKNFVYVRSYFPVNGFHPNEHELQIMEDGSYYLIGSSSPTAIDMSGVVAGGNPAASVILHAVQHFTAADELVFQWRALDHMNLLSQQPFVDLTSTNFDMSHMNSIDLDEDGHILLSSRNNSECTKINRDTGEVIWRLGGAESTLTFVNDPLNGPSQQHCFRALGHSRYLLLDNGNLHRPPVSRAVEYVVDPVAKTATLVWQFRDTPDKFAYYRGNVQRLSNGNTHINWCLPQYPKAVEVDPAGVKQLEVSLSPGHDLYRSWRAHWDGMLAAPYLMAEAHPDNITLVFNKFGDPGVDHYNIYSGTSPSPGTLIATSRTTLARLYNVVNGVVNYFRVTAVSTNGTESAFSNEENIMVNITRPGENMLKNGAFSSGTGNWTWTTTGMGVGTFSVVTGACVIDITSAGILLTDLQLRQAGPKLLQGKQYVLEFDANSVGGTRAMEVRIGQDNSPFATYYLASPSLQTTRRHFRYIFSMTAATDLNARVAFNLGGSLRDVVLDNVALYMSVEVPVTIASMPSGLNVSVDNSNYTAPVSFYWVTNTSHTIAVSTPQYSGDNHTRYTFAAWSDGGAQSHDIITPASGTNVSASFTSDHFLELTSSPAEGGTLLADPAGPWQPANQLVWLTAVPNPGFGLTGWSGVDHHAGDRAEVTMSGYRHVTAYFTNVAPFSIAAGLLPDRRVEIRFTLAGASQATVLGSTNLLNWDVLESLSLTNDPAAFVDDMSTNLPARYYRLRVP